ncbi:hypothetical protein CWB96_14890 [Pseudoalteromonas citrea]|uniref:Uncharacterized protein n=1 Tax=Pseudoalteromonas citrea TaxID=43655 RepID=A0A5S3XNV7_9GAMM|nr:hypothetical protein [Pseudoalteromonas citrea]TMP42769.1 hypothetical protein CWB97_10960 [Pseudoalteromonas citrea]TMP56622.1 hypothetical protein CWB96_14890 [Pseudoalteromonas citrea]
MDALKPQFNIVRLEVHHKPLFYIAGVQESAVDRIKLERAKREDIEKKKQSKASENKQKGNNKPDESDKHLDIWA